MNSSLKWSLSAIAMALLGCGAPGAPPGSGGTTVEPGACGRGLVVIESDYQSSNIAFVGVDGKVLSETVISSGSVDTGLSAPLTGDVVAPTTLQSGKRLAILDRTPGGVLTWLDVASGEVTAQLSVNTGFQSNPQDYVELAPNKAYVSRIQPNPNPGAEPFDAGDDLLIVDPTAPSITNRIDLKSAMAGEDPKYLARPNRIVVADDRAYVLLSAYALSWTESAESRLVTLDLTTDTITAVTVLDGLHGCTGLALSPSSEQIAVSCSGTFADDVHSDLAESGLVVLTREGDTLTERARLSAATFAQGAFGFSAAFADEDTVVFTTFGRDAVGGEPARDDTFSALHLASGEAEILLRSAGIPFTLGEVRCASACGACFVTDAGRDGGVLQRFRVEKGTLEPDRAIRVETGIGLPPRYLGQF